MHSKSYTTTHILAHAHTQTCTLTFTENTELDVNGTDENTELMQVHGCMVVYRWG